MPPPAAHEQETQVGDLPEVCLAQVIALTSPRDASRCAAVSPAFRATADSDDVWRHFLPSRLDQLLLPHAQAPPPPLPAAVAAKATRTACSNGGGSKKDAYLDLCDAGALVVDADNSGQGCVKVWLEKATGARCYALSARRLSLPWDDGELSWRWTPHPLSTRFPDVAELVDCTCLDVYGRLPAAALTPGTPYAAYLVYGTAAEGEEGGDGHRGLSFPDQETTVAVGGRVVARHAVCLRPDDAEARKFRAIAAAAAAGAPPGAEVVAPTTTPRQPRLRGDGWWEMEMGRVVMCGGDGDERGGDEEVVASFEVLGWYPKRGLIIEAIEFKPLRC